MQMAINENDEDRIRKLVIEILDDILSPSSINIYDNDAACYRNVVDYNEIMDKMKFYRLYR